MKYFEAMSKKFKRSMHRNAEAISATNMEPAFVKDEDIWDKAKKVAGKSDADNPWALTTYLYKRMGGPMKSSEKDLTGVRSPVWFWATDVFKKPKNQLQADASSAFPQVTRAGVKRESNILGFNRIRFIESDGSATDQTNDNIFKVALIQEGLGNLRDCYYYTKDALESAVNEFEGKKCYADHPSKTDEIDRPERTVRDIIGHFENVHLEENDSGGSMLCADLVVLPGGNFDWAKSLLKNAVQYNQKYPDKNFIGLSINAGGDAEPMPVQDFINAYDIPDDAVAKLQDAVSQGMSEVKVVSAIRDAISTDLVTEAGAKGKVLTNEGY